ncbi:hypothetical protein AAA799B03_00775 [Marine Group I thaumarchaeote SCGC AAA799-B03]|uniref:Uncharacterized protein n=4 Tax=Marine Group I TaxID=905826 RepID=A0A087S7B6_9ARCH|nr:hypothetical protein AAA799N04_00244 [Marine Group I thaumarchaeote SCGC AAA799-N04]KFM16011.1 hypothetical protein AAA799D11_00800 [Marine Group I thaumarchaeote SCGC AAA799-D11]KFM17748.1 hypothetical protein SCCGRSA3_01678 [Marine Group I thaumarchaeote SCGC RSA3]KFM21620.1 hypothetical protein AAA799B03_00775 [Marine Group I thaumarchaeote SCGC AAA799-B03]
MCVDVSGLTPGALLDKEGHSVKILEKSYKL